MLTGPPPKFRGTRDILLGVSEARDDRDCAVGWVSSTFSAGSAASTSR